MVAQPETRLCSGHDLRPARPRPAPGPALPADCAARAVPEVQPLLEGARGPSAQGPLPRQRVQVAGMVGPGQSGRIRHTAGEYRGHNADTATVVHAGTLLDARRRRDLCGELERRREAALPGGAVHGTCTAAAQRLPARARRGARAPGGGRRAGEAGAAGGKGARADGHVRLGAGGDAEDQAKGGRERASSSRAVPREEGEHPRSGAEGAQRSHRHQRRDAAVGQLPGLAVARPQAPGARPGGDGGPRRARRSRPAHGRRRGEPRSGGTEVPLDAGEGGEGLGAALEEKSCLRPQLGCAALRC
mmetsp:Transcript_24398/g.66584  ORF Transcript_24398/g.66584 Transcript_24398/m.66584 type:complete len:303 (-) Transcript_24398:684-1592(-)